ncbi:MAG: DMT family transporter [Erythrobacter sp.]
MEIARREGKTPNWLLLAALLIGNVALALGPWFVRLADTGPVSAGFWRLLLALPFLLLLARMNKQPLGGIPRGTLALVGLGSAAFALDLASWHIGIGMTRLGNATLFGNAGSVLLMIWGFVIARALPKRGEWLAIICALTGAAILLGRSLEISATSFIGDLFCLTAGVLYAVYLVNLQGARAAFGAWSLLVWVSVFACPVLLTIALILGEPIMPTDWTPILILVVTSQIIGQGLLVFALRHFSPLVIGLALLTQPVTASLVGWSVFDEHLGALDFLGMALVGSALVLARIATSKAETNTPVSDRLNSERG